MYEDTTLETAIIELKHEISILNEIQNALLYIDDELPWCNSDEIVIGKGHYDLLQKEIARRQTSITAYMEVLRYKK